MGNQNSSELDATIDKIIDLKNKPGLLKAELGKFVQQVPLEHTLDMKADKKLFDILMNLITLELKEAKPNDIHLIMMAIQRLLRVKGFYAAVPKCSIIPLITALQHKDPTVVMSTLNTVAWLLECRVPENDKKFIVEEQETQAKQAFYESKGFDVLINRVLLGFSKTKQQGVVAKAVDILSLSLVDRCVTTRFTGIQRMLQLLTPHIDLLLSLTSSSDLNTRCYGSILLQGYLLHSSLSVTQNLQSKVLEEGHLLWYILFAVDGANLPSSHPYAQGLYDKSLTELSRRLLGLLCAGNPIIVEISVQKTIPKPLQVSLEALNADSNTNVSLSAKSKQEKELIKSSLWNNFQSGRMKRVNLHPQFQRLDSETREPHILWTVTTKAELCSGLLKEIDELRLQKESRQNVRWDYDGWEISYKSLNRYLRVGGYYISLLLPVLQDKNSSYVIEIERIHMLLAALFQRSVVEDDPGWKLACLRTMSALYEKYGDQLTKDLEILPYFAWLIDPKHTLPIYRDQILRMLVMLMKDHSNVKRFVKSGGVQHLLYYISRVLTLPDATVANEKDAAAGKGKKKTIAKKKKREESDDEEDDEEKKEEEPHSPSSSSDINPSTSQEDNPESQKQNLLIGLPVGLGVAETALICLQLLRSIQLAGPKMKRTMSEKDVINTLVRLLMCPVPGVKEDGIRLLLEILDHSTHLVPRLAQTGLFSFLVYGLRNGLSPAILELISKYHLKQDKSLVPAGESAMAPYFPRALADVLKTQGAEAFGQLFETAAAGGGAAAAGGNELIWNPGLKKHLFEVMSRRLGTFRALLNTEPFAEYKYNTPEPIRYPSLESELCMSGVFLRQLNETGGVPELLAQIKIQNPEDLMQELITSLKARRYAGIDLLNILTSQVILIKAYPTLSSVKNYGCWDALFEILNNHQQESEFPMIEKSADIIHSLLSVQPTKRHPDDEPQDDEEEEEDAGAQNLQAFIDLKGVTLLSKTLEYFSSLKINNILIQRILIVLLHCTYDISFKDPQLVAQSFSNNKKWLRKNIFEYLGRKQTMEHPMLSVVTCKTLMALALNEKFQMIVIETGTLLHLIDMAVFYRSAASEAAALSTGQQSTKGMDEERRVRLAASSVLSVLAGYPTTTIHPEPNVQMQRVISALLTAELSKSLQNPGGFLTRCNEVRTSLQPLYKFIETELLIISKQGGEWQQKQWPFSPLFSLAKAGRGGAAARAAPVRQQPQEEEYDENGDLIDNGQQQYDENGDAAGEAGEQEYDENGDPIDNGDGNNNGEYDGDDMPDAYATMGSSSQQRILSPGEKMSAKMESLSAGLEDKFSDMGSSIGGAFTKFKSKAKTLVASPQRGGGGGGAGGVGRDDAPSPASSTSSGPVSGPGAGARKPIQKQQSLATPTQRQAPPALQKVASTTQRGSAAVPAQAEHHNITPRMGTGNKAKSAFAAAGAAVGAAAGFAAAKIGSATKTRPPPVVQQPPPQQQQQYEEEDENNVETMDSSAFYPHSATDNQKSPSTQHTPYGNDHPAQAHHGRNGSEMQYEEPVPEENSYDPSYEQGSYEDGHTEYQQHQVAGGASGGSQNGGDYYADPNADTEYVDPHEQEYVDEETVAQ